MKVQAELFKNLIGEAIVLTDRLKDAEKRKKVIWKKINDDEDYINDTLRKTQEIKNKILIKQSIINENCEKILIYAQPKAVVKPMANKEFYELCKPTTEYGVSLHNYWDKVLKGTEKILYAQIENRRIEAEKRRSEFYKNKSFYVVSTLVFFAIFLLYQLKG